MHVHGSGSCEEWIIQSPDVYVKSHRFTACLTSTRLVLSDPGSGRGSSRDLALGLVTGIESSRNAKGEPVLAVLTGPSQEEPRRLILTFAERPGFFRQGERDTWVQWIARLRNLPLPQEPPVVTSGIPDRESRANPESRDSASPYPDMPRTVPSFFGMRPERPGTTAPSRGSAVKSTVDVVVSVPPHPATAKPSSPAPPAQPGPAGSYTPGRSFFCLACGNRVPFGASFCNRCGASLIHPTDEVVRSPWDSIRLAARWGVQVEPAAETGQQVLPQVPGPSGAPAARMAGSGIAAGGRRGVVLAGVLAMAAILAVLLGSALMSATSPASGLLSDSPVVTDSSPLSLSAEDTGSGAGVSASNTVDTMEEMPSTGISASSPAPVPSTGTYVYVQGSGTWEGSYGAVPAIWAVRGTGEKVYKVGDEPDAAVSAAFRPTGGSGTGDLVVQVYKNGELVRTGTAGSDGTITA